MVSAHPLHSLFTLFKPKTRRSPSEALASSGLAGKAKMVGSVKGSGCVVTDLELSESFRETSTQMG